MADTVLVCDDAIYMRNTLRKTLTSGGLEVVGEAGNGIEAVEMYKKLRPSLVTMDIVMPDMGGIEAVRAIMKFDPEARVIMCSAMGQQALMVEAIEAGARDFVVKPFQSSRVVEAARQALG